MANYRTKNKLLLAKVEATSGQDASPTVSADAVLAEEPQQDPEFEVIQTNEIGASLDSRGPIVGGGFMGMTLTPLLKGAGAAGQPRHDPAHRSRRTRRRIPPATELARALRARARGSVGRWLPQRG